MSRNCLTETQYKNLVKDYSTLSNGLQPQDFETNEDKIINEHQNPLPTQRRKDYSKEVGYLIVINPLLSKIKLYR